MKILEGECRLPEKYDLVKLAKDNSVDQDFQGAWGIVLNNEEPYVLDFIGKFEHLNVDVEKKWHINQIEIMV